MTEKMYSVMKLIEDAKKQILFFNIFRLTGLQEKIWNKTIPFFLFQSFANNPGNR
jgi:hypothetical protein